MKTEVSNRFMGTRGTHWPIPSSPPHSTETNVNLIFTLPKSANFSSPFSLNSRFCGFISLKESYEYLSFLTFPLVQGQWVVKLCR